MQTDSSYVTLGDIYDRHCEEASISREDPILVSGEKVKNVLLEFKQKSGRTVSMLATRPRVVLMTVVAAKQIGILHPPERHHG